MRITPVKLALLLVLAGGGTGSCSDPQPEVGLSRPHPRLENTSWRIVTLAGSPVQAPAGARERPTLTFKRGFVSWTVGCNDLNGLYRAEGDRLVIQPQTSTAIGGCERFEEPVYAALTGDALRWRQEKGRMILQTPRGPLELRRVRFEPFRIG